MRSGRWGQTLIELIVGVAVFAFLVLAAFDMFALGSSQFTLTNGRVELQGELRRISGALRRDVLSSSFTTISNVNPVAPGNATVYADPPYNTVQVAVERDAISFRAIVDHQAPSYDSAGLTQFDTWTVYCPVTDPNNVYNCLLFRYQVGSYTATSAQIAMDASTWSSSLWSWASGNASSQNVHCYSNHVRSIQIESNPGDQTLRVDISLQEPPGRIMTGNKQTSEVSSASILLKAENTWPKL